MNIQDQVLLISLQQSFVGGAIHLSLCGRDLQPEAVSACQWKRTFLAKQQMAVQVRCSRLSTLLFFLMTPCQMNRIQTLKVQHLESMSQKDIYCICRESLGTCVWWFCLCWMQFLKMRVTVLASKAAFMRQDMQKKLTSSDLFCCRLKTVTCVSPHHPQPTEFSYLVSKI